MCAIALRGKSSDNVEQCQPFWTMQIKGGITRERVQIQPATSDIFFAKNI